ncbi:MAG: ERAP1-like C-terminal domain-containing protein [Planctomycetes bacterium]|nr:ERAP1-like C-terminal domain-containing protein [Planctomycetota bacterium]MCB9919837.1 ERAP1-like C-terminal domain-containing protein [Planctomycetota bacterium]
MSVLFLASLLVMTSQDSANSSVDANALLARGISRTLAIARREQIEDVAYRLRFELDDAMQHVRGEVTIEFTCAQPRGGVVLDWEGGALEGILVNEATVDWSQCAADANHIVLPVERVRAGKNTVRASFRSAVGATGTPLTHYHDTASGEHYYYTLVVPADCHRLFPCFDQPDLKATFELTLGIPTGWQAACNMPATGDAVEQDGRKQIRFAKTPPLPTYLFAFATGPFEVVGNEPRIFVRKEKTDRLDADALRSMHRSSIAWYEQRFDAPYPFPKLDIVLCPGFPYGGMEHAGAIFYRETSLVFDHEPSGDELLRRSTLIYHEVAHQWFGNLVTMPWFDEVWLKEGFATWASFAALDALEPTRNAWLRFHEGVKPSALAVDVTAGTVPVSQELDNLANAKSAYGPIVYNKAPAVLRELESRMGSESFFAGVARFLDDHAFGNASWHDLRSALQSATVERVNAEHVDLEGWSRRWIETAGIPQVRLDLQIQDGVVREARIVQRRSTRPWSENGDELSSSWPLRFQILSQSASGSLERHLVTLDRDHVRVSALESRAAPTWVLLNADDAAYGQFLPDERSRAAIAYQLLQFDTATGSGVFADPLLRAIAFRALEDALLEAELDPTTFVDVGMRLLGQERDAITFGRILGSVAHATLRLLGDSARQTRCSELETQLVTILADKEGTDADSATKKRMALRTLTRIAESTRSLELIRQVCNGTIQLVGLDIGMEDRFRCAACLLAHGEREPLQRLEEAATSDVGKYAYMAHAADATPEAKARVFSSYMQETDPPEQWITGSLSFFHWPGQEELTLPYLERALDAVLWVKQKRRIFFMPSWLDAFVNAHSSRSALETVENFLARREDLPIDVRRKLLTVLDELERTVRIREKFAKD